MAESAGKGRQKIEIKLIESEKARAVTFSKRKNTLFQDAEKFSTRTGADIGVMLFTPGGKPCSYGSTNIKNITDKYFEVKLEDRQRDLAEGKSNVLETFEDLCRDLKESQEKEENRRLLYKVMNPRSEIAPDEQGLDQLQGIMLQAGRVKKEVQSMMKARRQKLDLNIAPMPEEDDSSC